VLARPDELSRCCTPVDSSAPLVLPYTAADAQGHHSRRLLTMCGYISSPTWSPNGQRIAYLVGSPCVGTGVTTIHTADVVTGLDRSALADNQRGQPLLPVGGHFTLPDA
jgi:WD40-like Beta Propeller Repeat